MDTPSRRDSNDKYESDESGNDESSRYPDWYIKDEMLSDDDSQLLKDTSETTFEFETDTFALKGNLDYQKLVKTLSLLETQHCKTSEDIDRLVKLKRSVSYDPWRYLNKLMSGDYSDIPNRIQVAEVPEIDWSKYSFASASAETSKPNSLLNKEDDSESEEDKSDKQVTVRGRVYNETKPRTFNQLWTAEEQMRLEELLVEFPAEKNENKRWKKIAQALGNRTTKQVCSRVQKYFKKLAKEGLPIPGRLKTSYVTAKPKKKRKKRVTGRTSTFFPTQQLATPQLLYGLDEDEINTELSIMTSEMKKELIEKVHKFKMMDSLNAPYSHPEIKCFGCSDEPLRGTRWRCLECQSVSLCSDCVVQQLKLRTPLHPPSHPLQPLTDPSCSQQDNSYDPTSYTNGNYLDPNLLFSNVV